MAALDVLDRLAHLRRRTPALRLHALVDGAQIGRQRSFSLQSHSGARSLFAGTADEGLAHAGPWLIDTELAGQEVVSELVLAERQAPAVSWLLAPQDLIGLAQLLQLRLNARLPDGRTVLLRFWDPRVLVNLAQILTPAQREDFFAQITEWHLLHRQRRVWIGRQHDAATQ